jgi:hypothetical protein
MQKIWKYTTYHIVVWQNYNHGFVLMQHIHGANRITWATPAYFFTTFVTTFWKIFIKYSWNIFEKIPKSIFLNFKFFSYYFIKIYV